ncbi:MAG: alcohol dehydrogenase catalytic domain-containing protein [Thermoanaerobaculia bacterium]
MKAVRAEPDGSVLLVDQAPPRVGSGEALVRVRASGICGSDLLRWYVAGKAGTVLGHELAGEILEVGEGVGDFAPGDRVVPHHHAPCLDCLACRAGRYVHCASWRASRLDPGGLSELVRIPALNLRHDTRKVPPSLTDEEAAFTEPLATVLKAFVRGAFESGQSILVVGLGTAGQLAVRLARSRGARRVAGADRVDSRLELARRWGADETIDVRSEPLAAAARRVSGGAGFDLVLVCPGGSEVVAEAAEAAAPGGTVLLFTMAPAGEVLALPAHDLYFREIRLVPSYSCGPDDTRTALDLIAGGIVQVGDLVTHRFPITQAAEAFARAADPRDSVKVMITAP